MAKNEINLQIITPTRKVFDEMVEMVVLKTVEGEVGVLYDHEPVVVMLNYGIIRYKKNNEKKQATTMGGFAEITKDKVIILTDASELEGEVDVERAKKAKERAEGYKNKPDMDQKRAELALQKSLIRLKMNN
ncbi:ATP synthase F1 subunit epsilon [Candidatus Epulonipiscium fishelsonii]|uniref:ATP synthase F1 subunit epsilon n=1 Tax=Candidatus Epulonipiscium fishelsonii TaxID=77094 RepID=A0ACC8XFD3_9FIRM|nr:ATP synthase F1 subunit epsilon [Epulopiscium sp. SCG-D08WGA-EpuloA1]